MNIEEALKEMTTKRVSHSLLNGVWITRCINGKYYSSKGEEININDIIEHNSALVRKALSNNWFIVEGPRDRACG